MTKKPVFDKIPTLNDWKKLEYFSLPTYEKSSFFSSLIKIFGAFYKVYIESNYIVAGKNLVNLDLAISDFQLEDSEPASGNIKANSKNKSNSPGKTPPTEFKDIDGNFLKIKNIHLIEILETEDFNIEDKLFLNQFKFQDFLKYCKKLQVLMFFFFYKILKILMKEGNSFQKLVLFVRLLEFGDEIEKEHVMEFMYPSMLRNIVNDDLKCGDVIAQLFGKETSLLKGRFWGEIDTPKNVEFKNMMEAFMQQNKS